MDPFKQYRMAELPKNEMEMFRIAPRDEMEPYRMGAAQPDATYFSPYVDYTLPEAPRDPGVIRQLPVDQTPYSWQLSRGMERYNQAHNVIKDVFDKNILDPRHREEALDFYDRISTEHPVIAGLGQTFAGEAYDFTKDAVTDPASVVAAPYVAGKSGLQMAKNTGRMMKGLRAGDDVFDAGRMVAADVGAQPMSKIGDMAGVRVLDDAPVAPAEAPVFGKSDLPDNFMGMMPGKGTPVNKANKTRVVNDETGWHGVDGNKINMHGYHRKYTIKNDNLALGDDFPLRRIDGMDDDYDAVYEMNLDADGSAVSLPEKIINLSGDMDNSSLRSGGSLQVPYINARGSSSIEAKEIPYVERINISAYDKPATLSLRSKEGFGTQIEELNFEGSSNGDVSILSPAHIERVKINDSPAGLKTGDGVKVKKFEGMWGEVKAKDGEYLDLSNIDVPSKKGRSGFGEISQKLKMKNPNAVMELNVNGFGGGEEAIMKFESLIEGGWKSKDEIFETLADMGLGDILDMDITELVTNMTRYPVGSIERSLIGALVSGRL